MFRPYQVHLNWFSLLIMCYVYFMQWLIEQRIVERLVDFIKDQTDQSDPDVRVCMHAFL